MDRFALVFADRVVAYAANQLAEGDGEGEGEVREEMQNPVSFFSGHSMFIHSPRQVNQGDCALPTNSW